MNACPTFDHLLVLPHLHVQNANAISSPQTHGFPSITAFLGLMWALERKTQAAGLDIAFCAVGVVCHDCQELVTEGGFVKSFRLTRNPIDKDGSTAAIVEEGRIHLDVSIVFAIKSEKWRCNPQAVQTDISQVAELLTSMRIAGGTLIPPDDLWRRRYQSFVVSLTGTQEDQQTAFRKTRMRLLPGFALVSRDDLLDTRLAELLEQSPKVSKLDAWLSLSRINWRYVPAAEDEAKTKGKWVNDRTGNGWIVPIPIGYGALGELLPAGSVANARDMTTPFRFVESLYSTGEWISPHRLHAPEQLLWYPDSQPDQGLYRCRNDYWLTTSAVEHNFN